MFKLRSVDFVNSGDISHRAGIVGINSTILKSKWDGSEEGARLEFGKERT